MKLILLLLITTFCFSANISVVEDFNNKTYSKIYKKKRIYRQYKKRYFHKRVKRGFSKIKRAKLGTIKKGVKTYSYKQNSTAPKLAIIIDDISHKYQLNLVKSLPFKVTPSIFPPNQMNKDSNNLARGLKHFMVHLPLESHSRAMNKMYKTLFTTDSNQKILNRVAEIKRLFPNVKYINNHTGSLFTSNYQKSKVLYKALIDNKITFIDSRTSKRSVIPKLAKEFNRRYYKNSNFIDNKIETYAILREIKRGIKMAKLYGSAIIIGHPHLQTFKALKMATKYLKKVNTVYIDELW